MALSALSDDELRIVCGQLCNALDPRVALAFSSTSRDLRVPTQTLRQQLRAQHEAAVALCHKIGLRSCKELREARQAFLEEARLSTAELATLGMLGSVMPALETLGLKESSASGAICEASLPDGVQQLASGLGAGALPAVAGLYIGSIHVGDAGASALAAALGRGALSRLRSLVLSNGAISDAGLLALAPALRRLPALAYLNFSFNPLGDEGLAALVPTATEAGALPPPTGVLVKLETLGLVHTQVTEAGCVGLASALDSGALPALKVLDLRRIQASDSAKGFVQEALHRHKVKLLQAHSTAQEQLV